MEKAENEIHNAADGSYNLVEGEQSSQEQQNAEQLPEGGQTREPAEGGEESAPPEAQPS